MLRLANFAQNLECRDAAAADGLRGTSARTRGRRGPSQRRRISVAQIVDKGVAESLAKLPGPATRPFTRESTFG